MSWGMDKKRRRRTLTRMSECDIGKKGREGEAWLAFSWARHTNFTFKLPPPSTWIRGFQKSKVQPPPLGGGGWTS